MPVRTSPFRAAALYNFTTATADCTRLERPLQQQCSSLFHTTSIRRDDTGDKNHYETLNVQTNASPADIKKSFYKLSKAHHPDHNRSDPNASRRFMRISEAYNVLSDTQKRAKYDRDVLSLHQHQHHHQHPHSHSTRSGSYSSSGPAGGRPASGLSRRRGTFHGPPPSFYRSGGWGAHGAKRAAAHEESTGGGGRAAGSSTTSENNDKASSDGPNTSGYTAYNAGGMGPGQQPFGRGTANEDMPHFDRTAQAAHTRTQARNDQRRARRVAREYKFPGSTGDFGEFGGFFAILGILGMAVGLPYLVLSGWNRNGTEKRKKKKG